MSAERLLAHYERISDVPDAITRLRRFVLDLAVRGKLVPQNLQDEPASELLKRIATEKARLVKAGEIRSKPGLLTVGEDEAPLDLPRTWKWVRLDDVIDFSAGRTPSRHDPSFWNTGDHAWVSIADMVDGQVVRKTQETVSNKARDQVFGSQPAAPGTVIMSFKLTIGKIARIGIPAFHNEAIIAVRPLLSDLDPYVFKILPQFARRAKRKDAVKGATLNRDSISNILLPIPPLAEQHRIVAKIDEMMALCDRLESARQTREATRDQLTMTSLARLTAPDRDIFRNDARFALDALPALTSRADQIKPLRQTILNLAVRGKLLPQDPNDGSAQEALESTRIERDALVLSRSIRREKTLAPVRDNESPFDVPATWLWTRIGEAALFTQYGTSARAVASDHGVPVLTMGNIQHGVVVWGNEKRLPDDSDELPDLFLRKFDLLYNRTNSAELVGKTGVYLGEDDRRTFASYLIRLRFSLTNSSPRYVNLAMNAPSFRETQINPLIKKQTGQANVNGTALKNMLIPFPPVAEQHRIVAKVDELMALCAQLEGSLTAADKSRSRLFGALLAEALAPEMQRELDVAE